MRRPHEERECSMGRMIGYARVSTSDQDMRLQWEALRQAGCQEAQIFCDTASGAHIARPGLEACLRALAPGDMLVVWRLDRLGRSMAHLVTLLEGLLQREVGCRSLSDGAIDTTTASGELMFHIFSALAQFERRLIQERTRAGLAAARARGRHYGARHARRAAGLAGQRPQQRRTAAHERVIGPRSPFPCARNELRQQETKRLRQANDGAVVEQVE